MAEAKKVNGHAIVAYVDGHAVDSEGARIEGAPRQPKDTDPSLQPGANGVQSPEEKLANAMLVALGRAPAASAALASSSSSASGAGEEEVEIPKIAELDDHLASLTTVAQVKALQKRDDRVTAQPKYEARIAELSGDGEE
jgi:prepilin-type processing-associated H-X9-DG protein